MSETEEVVRARGVKKSFKNRVALSGLDLSVRQGQLYGLVGPNGAGKTTLIRILCGLLRPDAGEAVVLGWRVPNFRIRSQIGYMPQEVALYPDLTVMQNLAFFAELYDLPREQLKERAEELLALVELSDRRGQRVGTLSGGMQRRASLAASLLHKPRLLFLDEPSVGVDPRLRRSLWEHFLKLAAQDVALVVTTHLMEEAARCHVVGFLNQGRLFAEGSPEQLLRKTGVASLEEAFTRLEEESKVRT
ncbi:MAG: ABC transporter ATP-binding protein [Candidatus Bipolaricaulota bacterium]|nr:ABC transporter ATP-binding protein [Candidatus Bipolaricaulota bacterium]